MRIRRELWFGFTVMALIVTPVLILTPWGNLVDAHLTREDLGTLGLLMLALVVVAIMLGFPTAFTLMGMGVFFAWLAYRSVNPDLAANQTLDLMVQRTYAVMSNDVLIAIPLFVFMGYLVERAALIDRLFRSLHLALARVPGSLAVATVVTCAIFATATGIVGAVVTLMGLLAFPQMLKAGYNIQVSAGSVTAGGCLGILIPPSVLLIVYGATAGVSVVQLYAGAFFPGLMLALLYVGYLIVLAKLKPALMPPLPESERRVALPTVAQVLAPRRRNAFAGLAASLGGAPGVPARTVWAQLFITLLPLLVIGGLLFVMFRASTAPVATETYAGLQQMGGVESTADSAQESSGLIGLQEPEAEGEAKEEAQELSPPPAEESKPEPAAEPAAPAATPATEAERVPAPTWFWVVFAIGALSALLIYWLWTWERLEVFKMLLSSFFPLALLILAVLGSIVFGLATPAEAAAVGAFGGFLLTVAYRFIDHARRAGGSVARSAWTTTREVGSIVKDSSFLTAKTSAMV